MNLCGSVREIESEKKRIQQQHSTSNKKDSKRNERGRRRAFLQKSEGVIGRNQTKDGSPFEHC